MTTTWEQVEAQVQICQNHLPKPPSAFQYHEANRLYEQLRALRSLFFHFCLKQSPNEIRLFYYQDHLHKLVHAAIDALLPVPNENADDLPTVAYRSRFVEVVLPENI